MLAISKSAFLYKSTVSLNAFSSSPGKPDIAIGTDIIVGFPGETLKNFANTKKLFTEVKFDLAFISKYSPRFGTASFQMEDNVSWSDKKKREAERN
jgi:tRNA-2-methylthio-N6-dimethylallyladenosine synthase